MKSKKWIPILLMIWPYLVLLLLGILPNGQDISYGLVLVLLCVVTAGVYVLNIVHACKGKIEDAENLALTNMLIKIVHIPFYLLVFMLAILALAVMVVPVFVFISPLIALMLAVIDFLLMLTSSSYGINALIKARKNGTISTMFMVVHIIMHLLFVCDVISSIVVFVKIKKHMKNDMEYAKEEA